MYIATTVRQVVTLTLENIENNIRCSWVAAVFAVTRPLPLMQARHAKLLEGAFLQQNAHRGNCDHFRSVFLTCFLLVLSYFGRA